MTSAAHTSHKRKERDGEDIFSPSSKRPKMIEEEKEAFTPSYSPKSPYYYNSDDEDEKYKYEAQLPEKDEHVDSDYEIDLPVMTAPATTPRYDVDEDTVCVGDDVDEKASTVCGEEEEEEEIDAATDSAFRRIAGCVDKTNREYISELFSDMVSEYQEEKQNISFSNLLHYQEQMDRIKRNKLPLLLAKRIVEIMSKYVSEEDE